jgi:hypothetical protein
MGQLLAVSSQTRREPERFLARLVEAFANKGIEPLDMNGTLRCWTCGSRWNAAQVEPNAFWWLCPCLCNADAH